MCLQGSRLAQHGKLQSGWNSCSWIDLPLAKVIVQVPVRLQLFTLLLTGECEGHAILRDHKDVLFYTGLPGSV